MVRKFSLYLLVMIPYSFNPMGIDAVQELSDLDILRQIRDANPDSVLNTDKTWIENTVLTAWLESRDPNTWSIS